MDIERMLSYNGHIQTIRIKITKYGIFFRVGDFFKWFSHKAIIEIYDGCIADHEFLDWHETKTVPAWSDDVYVSHSAIMEFIVLNDDGIEEAEYQTGSFTSYFKEFTMNLPKYD
jgi:hypothetical protein